MHSGERAKPAHSAHMFGPTQTTSPDHCTHISNTHDWQIDERNMSANLIGRPSPHFKFYPLLHYDFVRLYKQQHEANAPPSIADNWSMATTRGLKHCLLEGCRYWPIAHTPADRHVVWIFMTRFQIRPIAAPQSLFHSYITLSSRKFCLKVSFINIHLFCDRNLPDTFENRLILLEAFRKFDETVTMSNLLGV